MNDDLRHLWARVEAHLRAALAAVKLSDSDRRQVEEFLDHNELGVAFQWTVTALADANVTLAPDVRDHLAAAASEMNLTADPDWRRLTGPNG
jgi:hypothetical protein